MLPSHEDSEVPNLPAWMVEGWDGGGMKEEPTRFLSPVDDGKKAGKKAVQPLAACSCSPWGILPLDRAGTSPERDVPVPTALSI